MDKGPDGVDMVLQRARWMDGSHANFSTCVCSRETLNKLSLVN